ncbi:MAG: L-cysteine:1D-myo-inosityl 2-amino-2-deoxy-alpha-D-glucopyranoside ligase MshC [uncultured Blastococcus sp.]|uniref:L-cysteine:1D-myo-inositol 2-amino-2-deoxy-alpha-D-glucopyranoside ligase n=1 Tax=uncultured Blastococcus sp. TaxID=217144 RepID=A0A6J4II68_9ACTN|nr:MAG: L-cysteine:1D-myo-inosityl 2-amino-2-deoxy-alpha-D-glucopyranoside ligase MshC [uncultured Blastococcus sp.]
MLSWPAPLLPTLPGTGPALRVHDTARGEVVDTSPGQTARMYVCGITPYDATHLGHAATYLAFDLINRVWRDAGHAVHYVQNVTDIDDPLLERADRDNEDWVVLAMRETALFREDMTALRVLPPEDYVGAVESIPRIVAHVEDLLAEGLAYVLDDGTGDIYHDVARAPGFGGESRYDEATMLKFFAERGGDPDRPGKRQPLDPMLWRGERPGEPSWPGPGGTEGRPGWHIECATIALDTIGMGFDVQGGGSDLVFPHHEYSAVHAEALTATKPFARAYVHSAMIGLDGEKMSKSRGNLVFVSKLRGGGVDPMAIRLALLSGHYRTDRAWTADLLSEAETRLATWRRAVALDAGAPAAPLLVGLRERLTDDLNSPGAIALVDAWAAATLAGGSDDGGGMEDEAPRIVSDAVDALLGVALDSSARGGALDSSARGGALDSSARGGALDSSARGGALDSGAREKPVGNGG